MRDTPVFLRSKRFGTSVVRSGITPVEPSRVAEEVVEGDDGLEDPGMPVLLQSIRGDERQVDRLARSRLPDERGAAVAEPFGLVGIDFERAFAPLHFAQVDNPVVAVDHQIDLGAGTPVRGQGPPGADSVCDAGNAQRPSDLVHVQEAHPLEGESRPGPVRRFSERGVTMSVL